MKEEIEAPVIFFSPYPHKNQELLIKKREMNLSLYEKKCLKNSRRILYFFVSCSQPWKDTAKLFYQPTKSEKKHKSRQIPDHSVHEILLSTCSFCQEPY